MMKHNSLESLFMLFRYVWTMSIIVLVFPLCGCHLRHLKNVDRYFTEKELVPAGLSSTLTGHLYGARAPLFRRESVNARITISDGAHETVVTAALAWLEKRRTQK